MSCFLEAGERVCYHIIMYKYYLPVAAAYRIYAEATPAYTNQIVYAIVRYIFDTINADNTC